MFDVERADERDTLNWLEKLDDTIAGALLAPVWTQEVERELAEHLADGPDGDLRLLFGVQEGEDLDRKGEPVLEFPGLTDAGAVVEGLGALVRRIGRDADVDVVVHRVRRQDGVVAGVVAVAAELG